MIKKIVLGLLIVLVLLFAGVFMLLKTKGDVLLQKFTEYVEQTTGEPLTMASLPSLTFFPSPGLDMGVATWGRKEGDLFVRLNSASVRVSASALLSGRLDITAMEVDEPAITMRLKKHPVDARPKADGATPPALPANLSDDMAAQAVMEVENLVNRVLTAIPSTLTIHHGAFTLLEADGSVLSLNDADLTLKNARPGAETSLTLKAHVERHPTGQEEKNATSRLAGSLAGTLTLDAKALLNDGIMSFAIRKAAFLSDDPLPSPTGREGTDEHGLAVEGVYNLRTTALTIHTLNLTGPGLDMQGSGSTDSILDLLRDPTRDGVASLSLQVQAAPRFLLGLAGHSIDTADPKALSQARLEAQMELTHGALSVTGVNGMIDDIPVAADLTLPLLPLGIQGELTVGDVKADGYLPAANAAHQEKSPQTEEPARTKTDTPPEPHQPWPKVDLALSVNSVTVRQFHLTEIKARAEGANGAYALNPLSFRIFSSPVTASASYQAPEGAKPAMAAVNISAPQLNLAEISHTLLRKDAVSGAAALNASLNVDPARAVNTLSGKGSLSAEPLTVHLKLLPDGVPALKGVKDLGAFDKAVLTFTADNGMITITNGTVSSKTVGLQSTGSVNLPKQTMNIKGTLNLHGVAALPFTLSGPLTSPSYRLDTRSTIRAVDQMLKEHGMDLKQEIRHGLQGIFQNR